MPNITDQELARLEREYSDAKRDWEWNPSRDNEVSMNGARSRYESAIQEHLKETCRIIDNGEL